MKSACKFIFVMVLGIGMLAIPALADISESFDGLTEHSYGDYDYNGFHLQNSLCNTATGGGNPSFATNAVRMRDTGAPSTPVLEYVGIDGSGKDGGVGTISFWYRPWDSSPTAVYNVSVNIDGGGYTNIGTQINTSDNSQWVQWTHDLDNSSDNIKIRVERSTGERLHVNDFFIADFGGADVTPPDISSITVISDTQIDVQFTENVEQITAETEGNYSVDNGVGNPTSAVRDAGTNSIVHLTFATMAPNTYVLTVNGVEDLAGNPASGATGGFTISVDANPGDVRINEVMYDSFSGADEEWVELHNTTGSDIDISGWILSDDSVYPPDGVEGALEIPASTNLPANGYLVISEAAMTEIPGAIVSNEYIGNFALGNNGDNLYLYDAATGGTLIDGYVGSEDTLRYPDLAPGNTGTSVEKCDEDAAWSGESDDWKACDVAFATEHAFCTPGAANSTCAAPVDSIPPYISIITVGSATEVDVRFTEEVEQTSAETIGNYTVDNAVGNPLTATRDGVNLNVVHLTFNTLADNLYELVVAGVLDTATVPNAAADTGSFVVNTNTAIAGDVVITEVMYDDTAGGLNNPDIEWVEVYNTTAGAIDISGWTLQDADAYPAASEGVIRVPVGTSITAGQYMVLVDGEAAPGIPTATVCDVIYGSFGLSNTGDNIALYHAIGGQFIYGSLTDNYPDLAASNAGNSIEVCSTDIGNDWATLDWYESDTFFAAGRYVNCTPGAAPHICPADTTPPSIVTIAVISNLAIDVYWDEDVDSTTASTPANYEVTPGPITPATATRDVGDHTLVHLTFAPALAENAYTLTVNGVEDLDGNATVDETGIFTIGGTGINPDDVVISEVMYDSEGTDIEWIEIYNTTGSAIDISGWIVQEDEVYPAEFEGVITIPDTVIDPGQYLVLCPDSAILAHIPTTLMCTGYFGLGNNGDELSIYTSEIGGTLVHGSLSSVDTAQYPDLSTSNAGNSIEVCLGTLGNDWDNVEWYQSDTLFAATGPFRNCSPGFAPHVCVVVPADTVTICEILPQDGCGVSLLDGDHLVTYGVVTYVDTCRENVVIEHNDCAVLIYGEETAELPMAGHTRAPEPGDSVCVEGTLTYYNGITEFSQFGIPAVITYITDPVAIPAPGTGNLADLDADAAPCTAEPLESRHFVFEDVTFPAGDGVAVFAGNTSYTIATATDTAVFYVNNCDTLITHLIPVGPIDLTGLVGQFDFASCYCENYQVITGGVAPYAQIQCVDPTELTVIRDGVLDQVVLRWSPGLGQLCDCYKIFYANSADAVFPGDYTFVDCVCGVTEYTDTNPLAPLRFYVVVAEIDCGL